MAVDLRELVKEQRRRLGLSVRAAATAGGISNTKWSEWENGAGDLGVMQGAVERAFNWAADWPDDPPTLPDATISQLLAEIGELRRRLEVVEGRRGRKGAPSKPGDGKGRRSAAG